MWLFATGAADGDGVVKYVGAQGFPVKLGRNSYNMLSTAE